MALGTKLACVMKACRYMAKDGRNEFQKYDYTTAAGLFAKVNEALTEQNLYAEVKSELFESRDVVTSKGNAEKFVIMKVAITIRDAEDPAQSVTFEAYGSGQDGGDKAVMKANTAALKYAYVGGLCIAMGDDPEAASPPPAKAQPKPKPQTKPKDLPSETGEVGECVDCGAQVYGRVYDYSLKKFGKCYCFNCQKKH